ncbi:site-specific DNA-methyltransferase [Priestia flexa]|uniref:site-specific DNA-methyltransferase n=1 Tax=Priestia flexa TaxID=86664 RepID=UPI00249336C0|nr:site-specific DNA-methyltransferase [Priestia flexa]
MKLNTQVISIDKITPASYNPRVELQPGDTEYENLKKSIDRFGYLEPIVWNSRSGNIVGGHQRFNVLKEKGSHEFEVSVVDLSDEEEKSLNLALNKISGHWDDNKLADLLQELEKSSIGLDFTGFNNNELETLLEDISSAGSFEEFEREIEEDEFDSEEAYENIKEPVTKKGDRWLLGPHKLICGDMTDQEIIKKLFEDEQADMVFTDPPYNVNYTGKTEAALTIKNDHMDQESFYQFLYDAYSSMLAFTKEGGAIYVCHADSEGHNFRKALMDSGWLLKQCIVWVKNVFVIGRQDYHWKHEPILYGWKPGAAHQWAGDRKQSTVWEFDKPLRNADHPTMKPIGIPAKGIQNSIEVGQIVFDPFGGSGSTLLAAEQTNRICYTSELDPKYCDVIVRRYEEYTGNTAKRIST